MKDKLKDLLKKNVSERRIKKLSFERKANKRITHFLNGIIT